MELINFESYIETLGKKAKAAKKSIAVATTGQKNDALLEISYALESSTERIMEENAIDIQRARENGMSNAMIDRLMLSETRIRNIAKACVNLTNLEDPVGVIQSGSVRPNGMKIQKISVPLGVVGIIYESRPNVTVDAAHRSSSDAGN